MRIGIFSETYAPYISGLVTSEMMLKKALEKHMSIYDLVKLHSSHLNFVDRKEDAKFIIDIEGDLTPFMLDEIASKWL